MTRSSPPEPVAAPEASQERATRVAGVPARSLAARMFDTLVSVSFAVTVIVVVALACVVGTVLPQGPEVGAYVQRHPGATHLMELFDRLGLTNVFSVWWFIGLLCLLCSTVAACSTRRFATARRTTGFARRRAIGSMLAHVSILLILVGGVIRGVWGEKGAIELREGQSQMRFVTASGAKTLPFGLRLAKFEVERYAPAVSATQPGAEHAGHRHGSTAADQLLIQWPERQLSVRIPAKVGFEQVFGPPGEPPTPANLFRVKFLKYVPDFYMDPATKEVKSRSEEPKNPAILVEEIGPGYKTERWLFAQFPELSPHDESNTGAKNSPLRLSYESGAPAEAPPAVAGPIKTFRSTVSVVEGGREVQSRTIEVNRPFSYRGYSFYQLGYNPEDLSWTSLQVVRDPGVPAVYAGFGLMIAGLFMVFYLSPALAARKEASARRSADKPDHRPSATGLAVPLSVAPAKELP